MGTVWTPVAALRRCVLALSVLEDVDIVATDEGALVGALDLSDGVRSLLPWDEVAEAVGPMDPETAPARSRLHAWARARLALAQRDSDAWTPLARPVGLPVGHVLHPGQDWPCEHVPGGALDLGLGLVGLLGDAERVDVPPPALLAAAGVHLRDAWPPARDYLERMGALVAARVEAGETVLRPMGDCDVLTLLGSAALRAAVAASQSDHMQAAVVPMRRRGWLDVRRVDPAFALAAASATDPPDRGFARPVLVTREEVALSRDGCTAAVALGDPATGDDSRADLWRRPVRYR